MATKKTTIKPKTVTKPKAKTTVKPKTKTAPKKPATKAKAEPKKAASPKTPVKKKTAKKAVKKPKAVEPINVKTKAELLCEGFAVTVTAASVGYPDVFSFSRAFKNHYGLPPTEYVKTKRL